MTTSPVPGTPAWLGEHNLRTAFTAFLECGVLTRNQISELTGLSKPTASQIVARLEAAGLITAVGSISGGRGPNAVSFGARVDDAMAVAIEFDTASVRSMLVDATGVEHPVAESPIDLADPGRSAVTDIRNAIDVACLSADVPTASVRLAGVGVPSAIDLNSDELSFTGMMAGWPKLGVRRSLEASLGMDVVLDNDVNLAAVAERCDGAGAGTGGFVLLWVGEGLGLAVDLGGQIHRGAAGGAGEIGYLPAPVSAAAIDPTATTLDQLYAGAAVRRVAAHYGVPADDYPTMLANLPGHPALSLIMAEVARRVATAVVPVMAILDPELVVLGGPIGRIGGSELAQLVRKAVRATSLWDPMTVSSTIPGHPVLAGARRVLVDQLRAKLLDRVSRA